MVRVRLVLSAACPSGTLVYCDYMTMRIEMVFGVRITTEDVRLDPPIERETCPHQ